MKLFSSKFSPQDTEKQIPAAGQEGAAEAAVSEQVHAAAKKPASAPPAAVSVKEPPKAAPARAAVPGPASAKPAAPKAVPVPAKAAEPKAAPVKQPERKPVPAQRPAAKPAAPKTQTHRPTAKSTIRPLQAEKPIRPASVPMSEAERSRAAVSTSTKDLRAAVSKAAAERTTLPEKTMAESAALRMEAQRKRQETIIQSEPEEALPRVMAGFVETEDEPERIPAPAPKKKKKKRRKKKKNQKKTAGRRVVRFAVTLLVLAALYFTAVFSSIPFIAKWRTIYIQTAMATLNHQWLATYFIPHSVIDKVMADLEESRQSQVGVNSSWDDENNDGPKNPTLTDTKGMSKAEIEFFNTFWEIDVDSMLNYVHAHPEVLENGWESIDINESSLNASGTTIHTVQSEQVLAIDAREGVLLCRESGSGYRGILVIAKDPSRLSLQAAATIGSIGQVAGEIGAAHNGILAMTGSGFLDEGGVGNGGTIVGWAMCDGEPFGDHAIEGYKRLELHEDNRFYIKDVWDEVDPATTDAVEFSPAMIVDGKIVVDERSGFNDLQPRACMGQSRYGEIIALLVEGRLPTVSLGISVPDCADIMAEHECMQAMNLDGGTSAMIWYKGDYIMKSSNPVLQAGRTLPNAFVYESID